LIVNKSYQKILPMNLLPTKILADNLNYKFSINLGLLFVNKKSLVITKILVVIFSCLSNTIWNTNIHYKKIIKWKPI